MPGERQRGCRELASIGKCLLGLAVGWLIADYEFRVNMYASTWIMTKTHDLSVAGNMPLEKLTI